MKIDMHVHSKYSVRPSQWILQKIGCPESFTEPAELYRIARERGMDMVTVTDHNTIAGSLEIAHLSGTFISEEVTTYFPEDNCKAHVLVYQIDENVHCELQRLRENIYDLVKYLRDQNIFHVLAHPLFSVNDRLTIDHLEKFLLLFENFELNGARDDLQNQVVKSILQTLSPSEIHRLIEKHQIIPAHAEAWKKNMTGGSDDHSSLNIARHYTEVPGASSLGEFFSGISQREALVRGQASDPLILAHNLYGIAYQFYKRKFNLGKKTGKDSVLRFLDKSLQSEPDENAGIVNKVIYSWRQKKASRNGAGFSSIQDLLRSETQKLLLDDPVLFEFLHNGNGKREGRAAKWFHFATRVSDKVLLHFWDALLGHLSGANVFKIFQTLGSAGALYTVLAPYFVSFSVFSRDRQFSKEAAEHFHTCGLATRPDREKVRMAHFTDTLYEINGVALTLQNHLQLASKNHKDLTVITCGKDDRPDIQGVQNFNPIGSFELPEYPEQKLFLPPFLEMLNHCYQRGFTHLHTATPGPLGLAALAISKILKIPLSGTYHTAVPQYALSMTGDQGFENLAWKYTLWFYDQLESIFVPSKATGRELTDRGIDPEKIRIFPRGVDTGRFHPGRHDPAILRSLGITAGKKLLYVGRISKEKNLCCLAQVFRELSSRMEDVQLVLVGDGQYLNELKAILEGTPCVFTGYRTGNELCAIYAGCDLFVFPSATDTFGNVVLEAQASGLPVVVTDAGGPQENMIPGKTGVIVKAEDTGSLLQAIESLLSDRPTLEAMGKAARRYMENRSYERAFEETWTMYHQHGSTDREMALAV